MHRNAASFVSRGPIGRLIHVSYQPYYPPSYQPPVPEPYEMVGEGYDEGEQGILWNPETKG